MKKPFFAVRGKLMYCALPAVLLISALYIFLTASAPVSAGGETPAYSVFELISKLLEG